MKPRRVLINTSAAARSCTRRRWSRRCSGGRIAGAGLDVFEHEPLPSSSPLRSMSNVLIAPHNSNSSPAAWERVHLNTIRNLTHRTERGAAMDQRVVAITGVAGGIGAGDCQVFAERRLARRRHRPPRRVRSDEAACDHFICADVADEDAPHAIFDEIASKYGRLDALVNNAACQICKPIIETTAGEWDQIFACNVRSVHLSVAEGVPDASKQVGGAIVNVSSVHAVATSKHIAAYAAQQGCAAGADARDGAGVRRRRRPRERGAAGRGRYADAPRRPVSADIVAGDRCRASLSAASARSTSWAASASRARSAQAILFLADSDAVQLHDRPGDDRRRRGDGAAEHGIATRRVRLLAPWHGRPDRESGRLLQHRKVLQSLAFRCIRPYRVAGKHFVSTFLH